MKSKVKCIFMAILIGVIFTGCALGGVANELKYNDNKEIREDWYLDYEGLSESTLIKEVNIDTAISNLKSGEGILLLGSADCYYCMKAFPVIDKVSSEYNTENIYYVDAGTINQEKRIELNELLDNKLIMNDDETISISVPDLYAIKNGDLLGNQSEVVEDKDELENLYRSLFEKISY